MSQGFLLFAHDNEQIQYGLMAAWQARRLKKWCGRPVSLVTDFETANRLGKFINEFDKVILQNVETKQLKNYTGQQLTFKNIDRISSWDLTPYDETIVLDTDIIIQSDRLNLLWNNQDDLLVCQKSSHVFNEKFASFDWLSTYGIKFYWATIFYFRKNQQTELFFEHCKYIRANYNWYSYLHDITTKYIRNDHIWSIALHNLGGANIIPSNLLFSLDNENILSLDEKETIVLGSKRVVKVSGCDLHAMNKFDLQNLIKKELCYE